MTTESLPVRSQVLRSGVALTPQSAAAAQRRVSMGDRWVDPSDPGYRPASGSASASTSPLARGGRDEESRGSFAGGRHEGHSDLDGPWAEDKAPRPQAFLPWYRDRGCIMAVTGYGLVAIVYCLIDELVPVFASTEPSRGGLGLTERDFSVPLGVGGAVLILYTLVVAPVIVAKVGHGPSVVYSLVLQAPMALLIPATGSFPGRALAYAGFVVAYAVKCACGVTAFTGCMFLVNKFSPPDQIGAVNGAGMTIASLSRAVGPIIGGWLWTTGEGRRTGRRWASPGRTGPANPHLRGPLPPQPWHGACPATSTSRSASRGSYASPRRCFSRRCPALPPGDDANSKRLTRAARPAARASPPAPASSPSSPPRTWSAPRASPP